MIPRFCVPLVRVDPGGSGEFMGQNMGQIPLLQGVRWACSHPRDALPPQPQYSVACSGAANRRRRQRPGSRGRPEGGGEDTERSGVPEPALGADGLNHPGVRPGPLERACSPFLHADAESVVLAELACGTLGFELVDESVD